MSFNDPKVRESLRKLLQELGPGQYEVHVHPECPIESIYFFPKGDLVNPLPIKLVGERCP